MIHLRIVSPYDRTERVVDLLCGMESVCNVIQLPGAARRPEGDVILADVAREDASIVLSDLRELGIHRDGSIALEEIDTQISDKAERAVQAARGAPGDAVVWEEVENRTQEDVELSGSYLAFMALAMLIAAIGIFLDSPILIVGAMVVGPEFGPLAGVCVAAVERRRGLAARSLLALALGFPFGITMAMLLALACRALDLPPDEFASRGTEIGDLISNPDIFSFLVAFIAGVAGMLSLSTAKSGALIGVLISVTTIPAAAYIGVAVAYADWSAWRGSMEQLAINLAAILLAGTLTLTAQRLLYYRRKARHLGDEARRAAGLPGDHKRPRSTATPRSRSSSARGTRPRS